MSVLEFRVWDNISKIMLYPGDAKYCLTMVGSICEDDTDSGGALENRSYRTDAMLSVGVKDRMGNAWYQGDIISGMSNVFGYVIGYIELSEYKDADEYMHEDHFGWNVKGIPLIDLLNDGLELAGNIKENPELLKGEL